MNISSRIPPGSASGRSVAFFFSRWNRVFTVGVPLGWPNLWRVHPDEASSDEEFRCCSGAFPGIPGTFSIRDSKEAGQSIKVAETEKKIGESGGTRALTPSCKLLIPQHTFCFQAPAMFHCCHTKQRCRNEGTELVQKRVIEAYPSGRLPVIESPLVDSILLVTPKTRCLRVQFT